MSAPDDRSGGRRRYPERPSRNRPSPARRTGALGPGRSSTLWRIRRSPRGSPACPKTCPEINLSGNPSSTQVSGQQVLRPPNGDLADKRSSGYFGWSRESARRLRHDDRGSIAPYRRPAKPALPTIRSCPPAESSTLLRSDSRTLENRRQAHPGIRQRASIGSKSWSLADCTMVCMTVAKPYCLRAPFR